ncbi:MAG: NADH-quinone oxidoreductase subunit N [Acidimicrobiales bacterium]
MNSTAHLLATGCSINQVTGQITGLCTTKGSVYININYPAITPFFILGGGVLVALVLAAVLPKRQYPGLWPGLTALAGLGTVIDGLVQWADLNGSSITPVTVGDQIFYDHMSAFFTILFGSITVVAAVMSDSYLKREGLDGPEPYVLMMACSTGAVLMADAAGLISLFLGLEILSIALYTMTAYHRRRTASGEAGLKYFILGSFSSAVFIYGVALIYGATGSTQYLGMVEFLIANSLVHNGVLLAGMGFVIVGLGFKVAGVPFHFWAPDVYQGAPTPFTGYMAAIAKAAGFAALIRVLMLGLQTETSAWRPIIWVLATLSVLFGSVWALAQVDLKRMLAYSSVSQAGYVFIGLQAGTATGVRAVCFYVFTYAFMVMGTFAVVSVVQGRGEARNDLSAVRGLSSRSPWLAFSMLVLLLGQAGIPLTSGFLGKWVVISAVIGQGQYALGLIGMLGAAIAAFFYLRVALVMYMGTEAVPAPSLAPAAMGAAAGPAPAYASDLPSLATAGLTQADTVLTLRAAPSGRLKVPPSMAAVVVFCVAFTIFAGVSTPMLSFAHSITLPWSV